MVSFQCEGCGDVLTKKKLDPHRGQCRGASYTCIDCMVHFNGTEYRSHTSCMTEAQKYQGALYKEKPTKGQKKAQNNQNKNAKLNPNANKQARVEDGSDGEHLINRPPPPAPTPPPAGAVKTPKAANGGKAVNVFDYLVTDETPNASRVTLAGPKEQMTMVSHAKSVFEPSKSLAHLDTKTDSEGNYDIPYEENGFSYGAEPIPPTKELEVVTPAPKKKKEKKGIVSEKKRKRDQPESFNSPELDDTPMMDAPSSIINNAGTPMLKHSGLTGGLSRMMRSPSIDDTPDHGLNAHQDSSSPIKKTRRTGKENSNSDGLGISIRNRAERLVSSMFSGTGSVASNGSGSHDTSHALVRRGSISSGDGQLEVRKRKSHRSRAASDNHTERKSKRKSSNPNDGDRPSRRQKHADEHSSHRDSRQVTIYRHSEAPARREDVLQREMAQHFLSLVSDGERGCSVHKALKRFHRDFSDDYDADPERRSEDEKDLWRGLRLRRNDRGEIVVTI
ncbi:hypothetical protein N7495_002771 [Penicillium taxi]|uniref:uncharacterized protein n=1 Tax=Penicillium taxi TaxID=168475 RepID=UPI0025450F1D|nr:uncharacterized protein N7495_002771 [Penicillium taxi]KAJ5902243.1 hypothetical protein N7495_002771 [Penicillium taxi]